MLKAIVEEDGRIRLPDEVRVAAHIEAGQKIVIRMTAGRLTLFPPNSECDEVEYGEKGLAAVDQALLDYREGRSTFYGSTEEFFAALDATPLPD